MFEVFSSFTKSEHITKIEVVVFHMTRVSSTNKQLINDLCTTKKFCQRRTLTFDRKEFHRGRLRVSHRGVTQI